MESPPRFLCLDTLMIDVVVKIMRLPERGSDAVATDRLVTPGGGFNAMTAAARQDMAVTYVGQLGRGPFADIATAALRAESIGLAVRASGETDLGLCLVLVEADGERTFVTCPGAEGELRFADLLGVVVNDGDYVFLSGYDFVYPEIRATTVAWLEQLSPGVIVAFDPGPRVLDIPELTLMTVMSRTDWFLCNATEATLLTGESGPSMSASHLLARTGSSGVVVRSGARGCVLARRGQDLLDVAAIETVVLDTNGAGDVHNGVLLAEVARGTEILEALRRANIAAAVAIATFGPATCPVRTEVSRRLAASY